MQFLDILVSRIHYILIMSYLDEYLLNLKHLCRLADLKSYKLDNLSSKILHDKYHGGTYCLSININNYINSLSLVKLLLKIFVSKNFTNFLFKFFNFSCSNDFTIYFAYSKNYLFFKQNQFLQRLIELFILNFNYDISILLDNRLSLKSSISQVVSIYDYHFILFFCVDIDIHEWKILKDKISHNLLINGVKLTVDNMSGLSLLEKGISTNLFFMFFKNKPLSSSFMIIPSLQYQFILMRQISLILDNSKSCPLFLLTIRINMLILLWVNIYLYQNVEKVFYLLDYLISLKLRNLCQYSKDHYCFSFKLYRNIFNNKYLSFYYPGRYVYCFNTIYRAKYYRSYVVWKLIWLYRLNFKTNLREAI